MTLITLVEETTADSSTGASASLITVPSNSEGVAVRRLAAGTGATADLVVFNPRHQRVPLPGGGDTDAEFLFLSFHADTSIRRAFLVGRECYLRYRDVNLVATHAESIAFSRTESSQGL